MKLSRRLSEIYNLVEMDCNLADIGSDHGQLVYQLAINNRCHRLFANDNKLGPFIKLKKNLASCTKIEVSLSDGISELPSYIDTIVIAGMGGDLISKILITQKNKLENVNCLILAPNNHSYIVRKTLHELGYYIVQEKLVYERHYYEIIKFKKGLQDYDELDYEFGPCLRQEKSALFLKKISCLRAKKEQLLQKNLSIKRRQEIIDEIKRLKQV